MSSSLAAPWFQPRSRRSIRACVRGWSELLSEGTEHDFEELIGREEVVDGVLGDDGALEVGARLADADVCGVGGEGRVLRRGPRRAGRCALKSTCLGEVMEERSSLR